MLRPPFFYCFPCGGQSSRQAHSRACLTRREQQQLTPLLVCRPLVQSAEAAAHATASLQAYGEECRSGRKSTHDCCATQTHTSLCSLGTSHMTGATENRITTALQAYGEECTSSSSHHCCYTGLWRTSQKQQQVPPLLLCNSRHTQALAFTSFSYPGRLRLPMQPDPRTEHGWPFQA